MGVIRMQRVARVMLVFGLVIGNLGTSHVYAQTMAQMREEIEQKLRQEFEEKLRALRDEFEKKLREAVEREVAKVREEKIHQEVKTTVKKELEAQPPQAQLGPAPMPPTAYNPAWGFFFNIELSGVDFWDVEADYAARNTPGSSPPRPAGKFQTVDVDREFAARPTLGYYLPNNRGIISTNFFHVDATGRDSFRAPDAVAPTVAPPDTFAAGLIPDFAKATNRVLLSQLDLQYQYPIQINQTFGLTPEVGIRGLWFKNTVKSEYFFEAPEEFFFSLEQRSDSWAVGPKIGLAGAWELFKGFTFLAKGSGGYLLGKSTTEQIFCRGATLGGPGCDPPSNFKATDSRGFPFVEGEFSLNYALGTNTQLTGLSASLGYRLGTFFSIVNRIRETGDSFFIQTIFQRHNLTYDSIFFRLQYLW